MPLARMRSAMSAPSSGAAQSAAQSAPSGVVVSESSGGLAGLAHVAVEVSEVPRCRFCRRVVIERGA